MSKIKMDQGFVDMQGNEVGTTKYLALADKESKQPILDEDTGQPMECVFEDKTKKLTLRQVIVQDVNRRDVNERGQAEKWDEDKSWNAFQIQDKVFNAPKEGVELEAKEKTFILEQVNKYRTSWIYGQVRRMLG